MEADICDNCGGPMVPGIPGEGYCPKDECFEKERQSAFALVRAYKEQEERAEYERLKAKFASEGGKVASEDEK